MPRYFNDDHLRRLRNNIPLATVLELLEWPHKQRNGQLAFLCPRCQAYLSAVNPRTNLGRCFHCETKAGRKNNLYKFFDRGLME